MDYLFKLLKPDFELEYNLVITPKTVFSQRFTDKWDADPNINKRPVRKGTEYSVCGPKSRCRYTCEDLVIQAAVEGNTAPIPAVMVDEVHKVLFKIRYEVESAKELIGKFVLSSKDVSIEFTRSLSDNTIVISCTNHKATTQDKLFVYRLEDFLMYIVQPN